MGCGSSSAAPAATKKGGSTGAAPGASPNGKKPGLTRLGSVLRAQVEDLHANYTLGKELGRGQFGVTYLATNKKTNQKFACKCIAKRKLVTAEDKEDVEREVQIMYHLAGHDNIVALHQAYEDKQNVQLLMEICEGGELFDRIVNRGHYSEKAAAECFRAVMKVVAQCHALGVIHRDLKPENFLLSNKEDNATLKATDFGLSVFYAPNQKFTDVVGSAYYVAPEVLKRNYGHECDNWSAGVILYILLCGVPPFWAETEQGIFEAVKKGHYDMRSEPWPAISEQAKDCVRRLLVANPKDRMTATEALNHPWVREGGVASSQPIDDTVMKRLKKFSEMTKFKKTALKVIAANLTDAEIQGLKEMFKAFDKDNSGTISFAELSDGLKNLSLGRKGGQTEKMKPEEVRELLMAADIDGDGTISYEEFITATIHLNKAQNEENLHQAFQTFDADNSGFITPDELMEALEKFGMPMTRPEVDEMIKEVDANSDGLINYEEFVTMMRGKDPALAQPATGGRRRMQS